MLEAREIVIPTPYGNLCGKEWGTAPTNHVLALHGWLQNANSFDRLLPLLSPQMHVIAIDLPGHGLSAHKPNGSFYHFVDTLIDIKRTVDYLNWPVFSFIGHNLGCSLALIYASLFPDFVDKIVLLDVYGPTSMPLEQLPVLSRVAIEQLMEGERELRLLSGRLIHREHCYRRIINDAVDELAKVSVETLAKRLLETDDIKYEFFLDKDPRLRVPWGVIPMSEDTMKSYIAGVKSKLLIIKGKQSKWQETPDVKEEFLNIFSTNCNLVMYIEIEGNHYVHLNNPERVAPIINMFFSDYMLNMTLKGQKQLPTPPHHEPLEPGEQLNIQTNVQGASSTI